ncbi:receptor-like protein 12 [Durio zibethinus]|uniref:Receptor-like protein 12 n=1 Tax=Durio zibethinus TaxID=66656 RepID=A0A6P5WQK2_DURZI|nr:receptor-like protein 12 [Durio zibethinus]
MPSEIGNFTWLKHLCLDQNKFEGSIPSSLFNISSLQVIELGFNMLSVGHLSSYIFDHLPNLRWLYLSGSQISGRIPTSLFKCKKLEHIYLASNQLDGTVPLEVANLTSLKVLNIGANNLTGRFPTAPLSLHWLSVSENNLVGEMPSSICNLSSLLGLILDENNLGGTIPKCIGNLSSLLYIVLRKNNFHGKLPENFAKGCSLRGFEINNNQLEGSLPRSLGNCKDLELLDVGKNNLNDTFPNWLGNLDHLQVLVLRSNRFYGHVDNSKVTFSFTRLRVIDLSHNHFGGCLPTNFFENLQAIRERCEKKVKPEYMMDASADGVVYYIQNVIFTIKGLEIEFQALLTTWMVIDFSNNQFVGEIPNSLGELHSLIVLNLSHNSLTGPIPSSFGDLSELESLDL